MALGFRFGSPVDSGSLSRLSWIRFRKDFLLKSLAESAELGKV